MESKELKSDEARRNFRGLLNEVEHNGVHVTILRWNVPAAVVVPADWYEEAKAQIAALGYIATRESPAEDA